MNTYLVESLAVHKRVFKIEAESGFDAIVEVIKAVEDKKMKNGDPLPEEIFDINVPPRVWPVWEYNTNTNKAITPTLSTLSCFPQAHS